MFGNFSGSIVAWNKQAYANDYMVQIETIRYGVYFVQRVDVRASALTRMYFAPGKSDQKC